MFKRGLIICSLLLSAHYSKAQQYGLFNTRTLFDGFENPAQKVFTLDSSRQYASNFFLPYLSANLVSKGNNDFIRKAINEKNYNTKDLTFNGKENNAIYQNSNVYLLTLKIFNSYKYQKELGFSWQVRTDAQVNYTNQTLVILNNFDQLKDELTTKGPNAFDGAFNNKGYLQTYHQFSMTYRENYNKRLAFGVKLSLLSGTSYNKLEISDSKFQLDNSVPNTYLAVLKGGYHGTFLKTKDLSGKDFVPTFKNPGASISLGTSYNSKSGVFLMANIKDLGFIRWSSSSYSTDLNESIAISDQSSSRQIKNQLTDIITKIQEKNSFYALTNAKADVMVSKTFSFYTPSLIVAKNLFYKGGDAAFVNKFSYNDFSLSAIPTYNFNNLFLMGVQGMYRTPNFEFFLGSDDLFKTTSQLKGFLDKNSATGSGYNGAAFYIGLGIKFGNFVEHPQNSSTMPGLSQEKPFFKRLFSSFSKKR